MQSNQIKGTEYSFYLLY